MRIKKYLAIFAINVMQFIINLVKRWADERGIYAGRGGRPNSR